MLGPGPEVRKVARGATFSVLRTASIVYSPGVWSLQGRGIRKTCESWGVCDDWAGIEKRFPIDLVLISMLNQGACRQITISFLTYFRPEKEKRRKFF